MPPFPQSFFDFISPEDAKNLYAMVAGLLVPFVVSILKKNVWDKKIKITLAAITSLFGALISIYAAGSPMSASTLAGTGILIFAAAQAHYVAWFSSLGLDQQINAAIPAEPPPA